MVPSLAALFVPVILVAQAPADPFAAVRFLEGDWVGEGTGPSSEAAGHASFRFELDGKVLVRRNRTDLPAAEDRPATHHEDVMTLFVEGGVLKAFYVDNEGHAIRYLGQAVPGGVAFTSEPGSGPAFRLSYLRQADGRVLVRFEIAPPGKPGAFARYLEGLTHKVK
jgi:hypothetical protein